jgi:hypothetical protein
MQIHQLSVSYQPEQDRVLMRVGTTGSEEMRLWLTRRLMHGLWPLLNRLMTDQLMKLENAGTALDATDEDLRRMLADFRKEEFLQQADFDTPFVEKPALPLGEEPLLVTDLDATPLAGGRLRLVFRERAPDKAAGKPRSFQVEMDPKLTQGLLHLLDQALAKSGWRDPFTAPEPRPEPDTPGEREPRPRYLN